MMTIHRTRILLVLAVLAAVVILAGIKPAEAAFPGGNGKIAFQSDRHSESGEIYTITAGETAKRITVSNGSSDPAYSPDGSRIAFISGNQIFVMNADGSGRRQVTTSATAKSQPTWSPDGSRIAYVSNSFDVDQQTDLEIWAINADGTGRTQLTKNSPFPDTQPAWSPLGDKIAFVSARTGDTDRNVFVMDADGSNQVNVTPNSPSGCSPNCYQGHDDSPTWSPDGSKIAYVHGYGPPENPFAGGGVPNVWVMDPNGNNKTNVSDTATVSSTMPAWSPQGDKIAYVGATTSNNIYVMNPDGSNQTPIDTRSANDINPDWQPSSPACDISGDANNNTLTGTPADETICGLGGNDVINGGGGNDILMGGTGNDMLVAASGRATLNGGDGSDTASFAGSATPIEASLVSGFARRATTDPLEGAALVGIERLTGSSLGDSLIGSAGANVLVGGTGPDILSGRGGRDALKSRDGAKNDTVNGGPGTDKCTTDNREISIKSCE